MSNKIFKGKRGELSIQQDFYYMDGVSFALEEGEIYINTTDYNFGCVLDINAAKKLRDILNEVIAGKDKD